MCFEKLLMFEFCLKIRILLKKFKNKLKQFWKNNEIY